MQSAMQSAMTTIMQSVVQSAMQARPQTQGHVVPPHMQSTTGERLPQAAAGEEQFQDESEGVQEKPARP